METFSGGNARASLQLLDSLHGRNDIGEPHSELLVHHDRFTPRHELVIDENLHRFAGKFVELDDASLGPTPKDR